MTRRTSQKSPKLPQKPPPATKAADLRLRDRPSSLLQVANAVPTDLKASIIANWDLVSNNIKTCVPAVRWPLDEPDPNKWHVDIVHILHEASTLSKGNNKLFQLELESEIQSRQRKNKSLKGKVEYMTVADLKRVCKRLESTPESRKGLEGKEKLGASDTKPARRGRSNGKLPQELQVGAVEEPQKTNDRQAVAPRGRTRPKRQQPGEQDPAHLETERTASKLPLQPARKLRNGKYTRAANARSQETAAPPPITPANPPENSEDEEEDQENEPPEPVSGRHIYGDVIKPTTVNFNPDGETTAQAPTRQTRKRGRANNAKPPTEVQIDSDPRDIDATGFLSELDPKEMRRRRKPRLSRLQQDQVTDPPWSQEFPAPPETPLLTPATDGPVAGTPAAPSLAAVSSPAVCTASVYAYEDHELGIGLLLDLLPGIPGSASPDERSMLQDRVALIHRDIVAYKTAVLEISKRDVE